VKICSALTVLSLVVAGAAYATDIRPDSRGLEIAGSSTVQPLAEMVGELYHKKYGAPVRISGGGTMAGIESVLAGTADIGLVSRALKESEKAELDYAIIGHDAVVIIVNSGNPVSEMRRDTLVALFSGTVRNWRELGGRDETVLLISKLPGRSTLELFEEYTGLRHPSRAEKGQGGTISKSVYEIGSNLEGATLVGGLPGAIGYVSMGTALSLIKEGMPLKILRLDGIPGIRENVMNGGYPIKRDLNLVFRKKNRKVNRFIDIFLGPDGQRILMDHDFIPAKGGKAD
jgi:phosphate transport system substrate-binding protein